MKPGEDHPILGFLEREVPADPTKRVLVVAPSPEGAAALRRALTERRGALLGVDFVTTSGLARQLLTIGGVPVSDDVPDPLEERERLRGLLPDNPVGRYARRFPGALAHLLDTVREWQTLGPVRSMEPLSRPGDQVVGIAHEFETLFAHRGGRSRWVAAATHAIAGGAGELPDRVLLVGLPEPERDLRLLLQVLLDRGVPLLQCPTATHAPTAHVHSCAHVFAELRLAARQCSDAAASGTAWHEMVVATPRLRPYLDHLRRAFDSEGVPFHTAASTPLIRHPRAALCLHIARLLFDDAPRGSFLALASSPFLRTPISPEHLAKLEYLSRIESLSGTGAETAAFVDRLASKTEVAGRIRRAPVVLLLRDIVDAATKRARDHRRRSARLQRFMEQHLREGTEDEADVASRIADCLRAIVFADGSGENYTTELEDLLRTRTAPNEGSTPGGVHVVEIAAALAFPCARLHLLGMSADAVPGPAPLTTFLGDADRGALGMRTTDDAREAEERLLGHLAQHTAHLTVSYSRSDADGRPQKFTLWRDRIERHAALAEEIREPGHPEARAAIAVASGHCPTDLAIDHLALGGCDDPAVFDRLVGNSSARILSRVEEIESFDGSSLRRDGDIGTVRGEQCLSDVVSVTAVQTLGRCPQQFLFERVMGIRALPEEPDPLSLPRDRIGTLIHRVIETLYEEFLPDLQRSRDPAGLSAAMHERARALLDQELAVDTSMLRRQFPGLHDLLRQRWLAGLLHAVDHDLALMQDDGSRPESVEIELQETLQFRRPGDEERARLVLMGKLDRVDRLADGALRVLDFKTGRRPESVVEAKRIFKGSNLQLVLYAMLVRAAMDVVPSELEARAVRPVGSSTEHPQWRHELPDARAYLCGEHAAGVEETVAILARLIRRGLFTPRQDRHCSWCAFKPACRRFHPPSAQRVNQCTDIELSEYYALAGKSTRDKVLHKEADA